MQKEPGNTTEETTGRVRP